ncbi:chemotaxis protein CheA [uncultured Sphingomonas sp.]|uniref:chemotaxis protein CheA n=1 Tax=uncultured Sphingomonas sp. TaxID=158754 RepID=UPI0025E8B486|nr:chemotaxis protein CheA [uncultured Sphingomonas sp.]
MDDLLNDFIAETRETLEALAGEIVAWEADPSDRHRLDSIFRFVHTVKGSCGFLDLPRFQRLSHAAEDVLADVRSGNRQPDAALVSAVLAIIDRIGELTNALEAGETLPEVDEQFLISALSERAEVALAEPVLLEADQPVRGTAMPASPPTRTVARSIRVPVELLDRMMAGVSDMVLARNELSRLLRASGTESTTEIAFERLSQCVGEMREAITRTRMSRIETLFAMLPRMVRDLSGDLGKLARLETDGSDVELDREMIEMIRDPLTHIVRNALDHGIESPEERRRAGKPEAGQLRIGARQSANQILIEIIDDGRGIDADHVLRKAVAAGLVGSEDAVGMSWARKLNLVFEPGLTTADAVTEVSGRGVGMDVVRANIERIGGSVEIDSRPGQGTRLSLRVPLTLTIIPALTVSSGGVPFAIPRSAIDELVRPNGAAVRIERLGGAMVAFIRGMRLPVVDLGRFMGLTGGDGTPNLLVVLRAGGGERYALGVDAVHDHEELVVKPAAPALMASGVYAGTTLPDNSRPMLLLDVAGIAAAASIALVGTHQAVEEPGDRQEEAALPTLLFRDLDGITRGIRLSLVERIEDVAADTAIEAGGTRMLPLQGELTPLHAAGPLPDNRMRVLRLSDGTRALSYAIEQVFDVVNLRGDMAPARIAGPVAGVVLHDGQPIEMLDAFWLFSQAGDLPAQGKSPLCLVAGSDDPWAREVLAPLLKAAGYRVSFAGEPVRDHVSVVVASGAPPVGIDAPVIRLRQTTDTGGAGDDSIYRYDRDALLQALRSHVAVGR